VILTIKRLRATPESTQGELLIDGVHECWTLEPRMDRTEGKPYAVFDGFYTYVVGPSQHFGRNVIKVENVVGFTDIELHPGNFPADTHGCCLVGRTEGENFVGQSDLEFDDLMGRVAPTGRIEYVDIAPSPPESAPAS
jgi:hypothetical protein